MQEVPPGPEFDRLRREMEDQEAELERQLLAGPNFPVYEVIEPRLRGGAVGENSSSSDFLDMVQLVWGTYAFADPGPAMAVWTGVCTHDCSRWEREDLAETLADERDRLADETDADVPEPVVVAEHRAALLVDGIELAADVRVEDECWAALVDVARTADGGSVTMQILVFARQVPLEGVRLARATDLAPYVRGVRELMPRAMSRAQQLLSEEVEPEDLDLPVPQGFEAHRELVEERVADAVEMHRAARENRRPARRRWRRADREAYARRWEWAIRAQMRLAGQDRSVAGGAVTALVNQMASLAGEADWFDDPVTRAAAIEESIRWTVFDSDVPSRAAQEAWLATWRAEQVAGMSAHLAGDRDAVWARLEARGEGRMRWLGEWTAWYARRDASP